VQAIGLDAVEGHSNPAGQNVQLFEAPPNEYIPFGHGIGE